MFFFHHDIHHYVESVRIQGCPGPYSVKMWGNADQNNSEYGHFSRSAYFSMIMHFIFSKLFIVTGKVSLPVPTNPYKLQLTNKEAVEAINPFLSNVPFWYPLKTSENLTFLSP